MTDYIELDRNIRLYNADCLEVFPELSQVATCITDPPYGIRFMSRDWDYEVPSDNYWRSVPLLPGGYLFAFGGTRKFHHLALAIEKAGYDIKDCISWLYSQGFPKSTDISREIDRLAGVERKRLALRPDAGKLNKKDMESPSGWKTSKRELYLTEPNTEEAKRWEGWGTGLKPAWEPIIVAMKELDGRYADNAVRHGVAGLNIDECVIELNGDYKSKSNGRPSLTGLGDNYDPETANQPDDKGRWPANVILDEEAARMLDDQTGILSSGIPGIKRKGHSGSAYGAESRPPGTPMTGFGDSGGASRFFYCAKASRKEKGQYNDHPTVKALALMEYLCKLTNTPSNGTVIDPFLGSGTTGVACVNVGRPFIGIEKDKHSFEIAVKRIQEALDVIDEDIFA